MTGGAVQDVKVAVELVEKVIGCAVIGDRGYDSNEFWRELEGNNNTAIILGRRNWKEEIVFTRY